jgi:hypothetical protein
MRISPQCMTESNHTFDYRVQTKWTRLPTSGQPGVDLSRLAKSSVGQGGFEHAVS